MALLKSPARVLLGREGGSGLGTVGCARKYEGGPSEVS
jgi:hypothetical protein